MPEHALEGAVSDVLQWRPAQPEAVTPPGDLAPQPLAVDPGLLHALLETGLFDVGYYVDQSAQPPDPVACITHYLSEGAALGLRPNRLFDPAAYRALHPDVAATDIDAFVHYVCYGIEEGRQIGLPDAVLAELRRLPLHVLERRRVLDQARALGFDPELRDTGTETVAVYASSLGNFFFRQIADRVASGFRAAGHRVYRLDQNSARPGDVSLDFVVAPHEFFLLGAGPGCRQQLDLGRSIVFNTEQPGTPWYFRALRYGSGAGTMVDLSPQSAALLPGLGFPRSGFLPLGPVAGATDLPTEPQGERVSGLEDLPVERGTGGKAIPWAERPLDVLFLGTLTSRRAEALARLAPTLARHRCFIHAPTGFGRPLRAVKGQIDEAHSRWLAAQAKVLINIHRGELPYFEWHRVVMLGAEQGAVVVSEPSLPVPGIEPGCHYVSSDVESMPAVIDRLLGDEGAGIAQRITARCRADLAAHLDLGVELRALTFLHRNQGRPHA